MVDPPAARVDWRPWDILDGCLPARASSSRGRRRRRQGGEIVGSRAASRGSSPRPEDAVSDNDIQDQLTKYLTDAHSIEEQALQQLRTAPDIAGDPQLSKIFADHLVETEDQERMVRQRLEARDATPSKLKQAVMRAGGTAFVLFARSQPDTPGKLSAHAFSYEHLELAGYELLLRVAERAGDPETAEVARRIRDQEQHMAERLETSFDRAVDASLQRVQPDDMGDQLVQYLTDAHAIESQSIQLLQRGPKIAGQTQLASLYSDHLAETR